jgi:hypothetical protein
VFAKAELNHAIFGARSLVEGEQGGADPLASSALDETTGSAPEIDYSGPEFAMRPRRGDN